MKNFNIIIHTLKGFRFRELGIRLRLFIYLLPLFGGLSCSDYLNIVPDNTITLEDYFVNQEMAYEALSKVYSYLPPIHYAYNSTFLLGDEWVSRKEDLNNITLQPPSGVMMGGQNNDNPLYGLWTGSRGAPHLYKAIRSCNIFLQNIHTATDMSERNIKEWSAQVKFLKAYYHYQLLEYYGPIVIVDKNLNVDDSDNEIMQRRQKVDDCFNYVINLIDEAIPDLQERISESDLGMVDKKAALSIKARILLLRASPFFNGNKEYYADFLDFDGQPFFPMDESRQKWEDALAAVNEAIRLCEDNGAGLYEFEKIPYSREDDAFFAVNPDRMKTLYSLKMVIPDKWNKELLWGRTPEYADGQLQFASAIRTNSEEDQDWTSTGHVWNWLGANYSMLESYYTQNGLPINVDMTFSQSDKYDFVITPDTSSTEYPQWAGIIQPNVQTIYLYLNRELRFYANLGITGGYWRQHRRPMPTMMLPGTDGGVSYSHGTIGQVNFFWSGIGVQKFVHPESRNNSIARMAWFPYPFIRMADLYLMKAEILNELNSPGQEVWDEVNKIRRRAGIPDVDVSWSNPAWVSPNYINSHKDKNKMREIILKERSIELAFEGTHFFDIRRYKRAVQEFNTPTMGWEGDAATPNTFFVLSTKQQRRFLMRDNLWPLPLSEMNINPNLKQNPEWPGWDKK
ncbi:MAG: RagB/SusD family nutrient uptake outer membrane protein [Tannerella sp.]|jgi:hypothetical protein|nr:RagB/SusD family nutrient uptake outer membrane protein [Tannerella sp.]